MALTVGGKSWRRAANRARGGAGGGGEGLGLGLGSEDGPGVNKEKGERKERAARLARINGTWREVCRRRRRVRAAWRRAEQRKGKAADRWGPAGFLFSFPFFFQGCDTALAQALAQTLQISPP